MIWTMIYKTARRLAASLLFHTQWTSEPSYFIQMDSIGTQIEMLKTNIQFESVCEQIRLLNHRLDALQTRYSRATSGSNNRARYTLRLQVSTLENIRNMFVEYASSKADHLIKLQCQLSGLEGMDVEFSQ